MGNHYGIDEAWERLTPTELKTLGKDFVVGYVSEDNTGKNLTVEEVQAYHAAGLSVLLVYEYSTTAVHGGTSKGHADASIAIAHAQALGYPTGCAIAFAVDENTSNNPSIIDGYASAFTANCHGAGYRSMDYGGLATVRRCADLHLTDLHWQTYAWSNGVWDPRVAIRQIQNDIILNGKNVDFDTAMVDDYGAWMGDNMASMAQGDWDALIWRVEALINNLPVVEGGPLKGQESNKLHDALQALTDAVTALQTEVKAMKTAYTGVMHLQGDVNVS